MINPSLLALTTLATGPTRVVNKKHCDCCGLTTLTTLTTARAQTRKNLIFELDITGGGGGARVSHILAFKVVKVVKPAWLRAPSLTTCCCPVVKVVKIPDTVSPANFLV